MICGFSNHPNGVPTKCYPPKAPKKKNHAHIVDLYAMALDKGPTKSQKGVGTRAKSSLDEMPLVVVGYLRRGEVSCNYLKELDKQTNMLSITATMAITQTPRPL